MRRLITVVIIGLGIAIALYRLVRKENRSVQHKIAAPMPATMSNALTKPGLYQFGIQVLIARLFAD